MKPYLDNAVVSAIGKNDVAVSEMKCLEEMLSLAAAHTVGLLTSSVTGEEIARYQGQKKGDIERVYASLAQVHFIEDHEVGLFATFRLQSIS